MKNFCKANVSRLQFLLNHEKGQLIYNGIYILIIWLQQHFRYLC